MILHFVKSPPIIGEQISMDMNLMPLPCHTRELALTAIFLVVNTGCITHVVFGTDLRDFLFSSS